MPDDAALPTSSAARLDAFTVLRRLGVGPDGASVLARGVDGREVELVFLSRIAFGTEAWSRAEARVRRAAVLTHPIQRAVQDILVGGPSPAVQLEWPGGQTLGERLSEGPMTRRSALTAMERLAHGVFTAHRMGLIHGALSPSSVLVAPDGKPRAQFTGLRVYGADVTAPLDDACRPPEYAAGEGEAAHPDTDTDVYALAALTLCTLAGAALSRDELRANALALGGSAGEAFSAALDEDRALRPSVSELCLALRELVQAEAPSGRASVPPPSMHTGVGPHTSPDSMFVSLNTLMAVEPKAVNEGAQLGRFKLVRLLGEGGMGQVYAGVDLADGRMVAVKVLRPELSTDERMFKRFKKEARLLEEARSPFVANLVDVNVDRGVHFLALEFVEGESLQSWLDGRDEKRLPEREALELLGDACRALAEPHRRGIIHRDLKPDNLMFAREDHGREPGGPRVKVVDFGIARSASDGQKEGAAQLTQEGAIIGTPQFMAPEQCRAKPVSPATDVYALGVTLYLLLAGRAPFESEVPTALLVMHLSDEPPALKTFAPDASDAVSALVARALKKDPGERFADATDFLDAIERILRGDPSHIELRPALPDAKDPAIREVSFTMDLQASPQQLWPYLSDSDRLNRLVGLPAPTYEVKGVTSYGEGSRKAGYSVNGLDLEWDEAPFEWVEGRRWGSLRVFEKGSMKWLLVDVELEKLHEGKGTRVTYRIRYAPKFAFAGFIVRLEMLWRQFPRLKRAFALADASLTGKREKKPEATAFGETVSLGRAGERRLQEACAQMVSEGRDARVVEHLAGFVRSAPEQEATRLRPLAFADAYGLVADEVVATCLHAARKGVLLLTWDVLCPLCRVPTKFADSLRAVEDHADCPACNKDFTLDFASSIELVFRVAPAVRKVERKPYCVGGPAIFPHVAAQLRLRPGERFALQLALETGEHRVRVAPLPDVLTLRVAPSSQRRRGELVLAPRSPAPGDTLDFAPGEQHLVLTNSLESEALVRVERMAARRDALTAARAAAMPVFRELFPDEVLSPGQLVSVTSAALLATAIPGADALFSRLGDAKAFPLVLAQLRAAGDAVHAHGGSVLKTVDAGLVASFETPLKALNAAMLLRDLAEAKRAESPLPMPRIALHQGAVMAATIDERLDYFGQNVSVLRTLLEHANEGETVLSRAAFDDPDVASTLAGKGLSPEAFALPGWGAAQWAVRVKL